MNKKSASIHACLKRIDRLEATLKAIRTWAAYDIEENRVRVLTHGDVIKACDRALKGEEDVD